jgi:hypothetical protein
LRQVTEEEEEELNLPPGALVVKTCAEGGPKDEITFIGLTDKSETEV